MSLSTLSNFCSHIQNATKAHLSTTSFPETKQILAICLALQQQGFLSSVTRGNSNGPDETYIQTTQENIATRRLWLDLKYYDGMPVLRQMYVVSRPKKPVSMKCNGLKYLLLGREHEYIEGLRPGECLFLRTDLGYLEAREAVSKRVGGQLLCRAL